MDIKILALLLSITLASCGGINSFHEQARAGDTVAIPVGMQPDFSKDNITVTITPSSGSQIIVTASDPTIEAVVNLYPDPLSNMLVSRAIGEDLTPAARTYSTSMLFGAGNDKDWFQTTVFLDLPTSLPIGTTQIEINNGLGASHTVLLEIIPGSGVENSFLGNLDPFGEIIISDEMFDSLARASHTIVNVASATTIPHAVEITLSHDPDSTAGGSGKAFIVNPLGYLKSTTWSDDGTNMKVILMQNKDGTVDDMNDYKFYVAGTTTGLTFGSVKGYDINGNELTGITTTLTVSN